MLVRDFMQRDTTVASLGSTVESTLDLMKQESFRVIFVVDGEGGLSGFLTYNSIADQPGDRPIDDYVSRANLTVQEDDPVDKAVVLIKDHNLMVLPVVDEDRKLAGILTPGKLFEAFSELLNLGQGGLWITLTITRTEDLPRVLEVLIERGVGLQNLIADDQDDELEVVLKVSGIKNSASLEAAISEVIE
ncbi:MAG: CBS domain-containing protein [Candidatus Acetothermia bacterium]